MSVREWSIAVVLTFLLLIAFMSVPVAGAIAVAERSPADSESGPAASYSSPVTVMTGMDAVLAENETNATTRQHSNPQEAEKSGNLGAVKRWLGGRMDEVLIDCTDGIQAGNYEVCDRLDEDYPGWLERYIDVTRETGNESDDQTAESYKNARENQSEYAKTVREFRQTYEAYQEARDNGNTTRARRLARKLVRLGKQANTSGANLIRSYNTISARSDVDFSTSAQTIAELNRNLSGTTQNVKRQQFIRVTVTATAASDRISFTDPLEVSGQVTTENGTDVTDQRVLLIDEEQRVLERTRTDESGAYSLTYRPTTDPLGPNMYTVVVVPQNLSVYLGANATTNVTVEQVAPTVRVSRTPDSAGFNDTVTVTGHVTVPDGDIEAANVPVVVTVGRERLGRVSTNESGEFSLMSRLPATVPAGEQEVRARLPLADQALASDSARAPPLDVTTTETTISISATRVNATAINTAGRLMSIEGTPIANQPVTITFGDDGPKATTVRTDGNGRYNTTVTVPEKYGGAQRARQTTITVRAVYDEDGTNLEATTAQTQVVLPSSEAPFERGREDDAGGIIDRLSGLLFGSGDGAGGAVDNTIGWFFGSGEGNVLNSTTAWAMRYPKIAAGVSIVLIVSLLGLAFGVWRLIQSPQSEQTATVAGEGVAEADTQGHEPIGVMDLLDQARTRLDSGNLPGAVTMAYVTARTRLQEAGTVAQTHWEFYHSRRNDLSSERAAALERLTEAYEQTAFGNTTPTKERAREVLAAAEDIVTDEESVIRTDGSGPSRASAVAEPDRDTADD